MSGNKEGRRLHESGAGRSRPDHSPRQGDDRTRNRRLADVRRGNKSRHQLQLLASARGGSKQQSSTPSSWGSESRVLESWSAKEKRELSLPNASDLETRRSCPALPAIASSLGIYHDRGDSKEEFANVRLLKSPDRKLFSKTKEIKQNQTRHPNFPKEEGRVVRKNSVGILANSHPQPSKAEPKVSTGKPFSNFTPASISPKNQHAKSFENEFKSKRTLDIQNIAHPGQSSKTSRNDRETESSTSKKDGKETRQAVGTGHRYSVLLNGGTLATNAPYVDRISSNTLHQDTKAKLSGNDLQPDYLECRLPKAPTSSSEAKEDARRLQKSTTAPRKRESVPSPSRRRGRHLRSHKELFAFQQDLLLPRYRKLAGIAGNETDDVMPKSDRPPADESQGDGGNTRRSDAREVFEKVRLIIKGPEKEETVSKPTDRKVPQMMPIYLKSGLPCGYVDPSSKCDAWLYSNDFEDRKL